jgi:PAS domain S-box-containing protein
MGYSSDSWLSFNPSIVVLPLLLWLAARCPPVFAIAGAFVASILVIWATTYGIGRYGDAAVPIMERVKGAQAVVATGTVGILVLTVLFVQRKKAEEGLRQSEGQLAKERTMLARLHEVGSRLWLKRDLRQALDEILAGAIELLGADMGAIRIFDATQGVLKIGAHRGFGQEFLDFFREVSAADDSACGRVLRSGERMVIEDVEADTLYASFHPIAHAAGYRAVQSTPIISREGALLGTLATHFRSAHKPTQQDLHLLDLYVHQAAEIIERYKAEDALRESEERLRLTQLRTGIGIWDLNLRTGKLTWTREQEAIFGVEPETVNCYADFRNLVHPDDIEKVDAARNTAVQRRETFEHEFRIICPSGRVRWVSSVGGAFYDEATNEPVRILGNNIDITERKEAELALSERNLQLSLAGKAGLVGSYVYDGLTETFQISEGCAAIHGLPEDITTITRSEWRACVHPEDVQRIQAFQSEVVGKRQPEYNVEYRILRSGGEVRWIESRSFISYGSEGQPQRVVGVTIDITERKRAELALAERNAQLALAGRAALVGNYTYDVNKGVMQVSEGYAAIHGLPEGTTETSYSEWRERVHPDDLLRAEGLRDQAFADRWKEDNAEYRIVLATGEIRWIERRGSISYGEDGRPQRVTGVNIDVTERKRAEQRQRALNAELDHRVKNSLATISAVVSHTLNASGSMADFATALEGRVQSMARTHELLSASRWHGISVAELVRRELAPYATNGNTEVNGPEVILRAEAGQVIAMVLHELATNAAKYGALSTQNGRVSISWRRRPNGHPRSHLVIEWREIGGSSVITPGKPGYGTRTIRNLVPYELRGTVDLAFAPEGIRCRLELPANWLINDGEPVSEAVARAPDE